MTSLRLAPVATRAMRVSIACLALAGAAPDASGASEETPVTTPITILDATSSALRNFPSLRASSARHEAAQREIGEATAARLPSVSLSASAIRHEEPMVATPIHGFSPGVLPRFDDVLLQGALTSDWLLLDGGGRGARIDERRSLAEAAGADASSSEAFLLQRTIATFLRVLGATSTLSAHDRRIEALAAELERARQLTEVGRAAHVDLLRAEAAEAAATAERVRLASALDVAERDLARLAGFPVADVRGRRLNPVRPVEDSLPSREACREGARAANAELLAAEHRARAAAASLRAGRSARWPSLSAAGSVLHYASPEDVHETEWNAGVRAQVPVFTGGAISSRIGRAEAAHRSASAELDAQRLRVEEEIDRGLAMAEEARARRESLARAVAGYEEVARIEKLRLDTESGTQTDWLDAEAELLSARSHLVEADYAEVVARAELARVTGQLNLDWVARTLEVHR